MLQIDKIDTNLKPNYRNYNRYERCKNITKPYILGCFSVDQNLQFIPDYSKCQYLKLPPSNGNIHFDLNEGYENVQHKPQKEYGIKLDHILKFISLNLETLYSNEPKQKLLKYDIICYRGKLRMLMCTPYEFKEGWSLCVTKWKGNIYLCEFETERAKARRLGVTEQSVKICSYGFKFEQFMMSKSPAKDIDTSAPVLEAEEFCCVFTSKLGNTTMLYGAEMDGIESETTIDLSKNNLNDLKFTELKVRIKPSNQRQVETGLKQGIGGVSLI
ncbi:Decapping and exoribonuclease protein [Pseudolycoriella hygida]|uniref:Decapping nuclease n=1 Tax=Pseudolycoriella hygida TaxID=35572 RepID=A0A9Q0S377_9DIPT|nr:Decapping and exoribonuclease protein [Pseudolycoriella hygida]